MPEYAGIKLKLQSQYDNLTIPEFPPRPPSTLPSPQTDDLSPTESEQLPRCSSDNIMDLYIPIYHGSQFWIVYTCDEPEDGVTRYYYFKLCVNGKCLLSWGSGAADCWSGRITYGMYEGPRDFEDKPIFEKRSFFFPPSSLVDAHTGGFEIQIFRAKARKRENVRFESWVGGADGRGICMSKAGHVKRWEPKRLYTYALIDPVDKPLVTFRYHCRTGGQLGEMDIPLIVPDGNVEDLMTASPSKREQQLKSPILFSPPPKEKPRPPPKDFAGKDSIALRRASMPPRVGFVPRSPVVHDSPVKKHQNRGSIDIFDALEGLSLAKPANAEANLSNIRRDWDFHLPSPKKKLEKQLPGIPLPLPRVPSSSGFFSRLKKRRLGSRDEAKSS